MFFDDDFSEPWGSFFGGFGRRPFGSRLGGASRALHREISSDVRDRRVADDVGKKLTQTKDGFQMSLNVYQFAPSEITVKTVDDTIVIEGKHEEKVDEHGYVARQFTRRYKLPKEYDAKEVISSLSSDGVLTIRAPSLVKAVPEASERVIPIQHTGPAPKDTEVKKEME